MKKTSLVALAMVFVVSVFTSCSGRDDTSSSNADTTVTNTTTTISETTTSEETEATVTTASSVETTESRTETEATTEESKPEESKAPENASRVVLDVKNIQMLPELPKGSEITCAAMVLNYYGIECDKMDLLENLPMSQRPADPDAIWVSPSEFYLGDPRDPNNPYGCYSGVIIKVINDYLAANNISEFSVINLRGKVFDTLYDEIANGTPVIMWATYNMQEVESEETWIFNENFDMQFWPKPEHCFVLIGYDTEKDTLIFNDPASEEIVEYPKASVQTAFDMLGNQAIAIHKT